MDDRYRIASCVGMELRMAIAVAFAGGAEPGVSLVGPAVGEDDGNADPGLFADWRRREFLSLLRTSFASFGPVGNGAGSAGTPDVTGVVPLTPAGDMHVAVRANDIGVALHAAEPFRTEAEAGQHVRDHFNGNGYTVPFHLVFRRT